DVGGMTKIGRSVKEYTNFYDRAYWRLGKRLAEPSYDLFAVAMVLLATFYPRKFTRKTQNLAFLRQKINNIKTLGLYRPVLQRTLTGKYPSARAMRNDLYRRFTQNNQDDKSVSWKSFLTEILLIGSFASLYYGIYVFLM